MHKTPPTELIKHGRPFKPYPAYKDSGVEWLGEIPAHWSVLAIKRVTSIPVTDGPHETPELLYEGIPFISAEAIKNDKIDFIKMRGFISAEDHARFSRKYKPQRGDIFLIKSGATTGNVAFVDTDEEFNIWSPLAAIRPKHKVAHTAFVFFFMKSREFFQSIELGWSYGTQQNISMNVIENIPIVIPPLLEQRAIAAFLDRETARIDALVAKKERLIELLQEKRSALITRAVTKGLDPNVPMKDSGVQWLGEIPAHWEVKGLKRVASLRAGAAITSESIEESGTYPVFGGNGIRGFTSSYTHEGEFPLIGRQGALCGCVNFASGRFWASEHAVVAAPRAEVHPKWLAHLLRGMSLNSYSESAAQPGLAVDTISSLPVPAPGVTEQLAIAEFVDRETTRIDTLIAKVRDAIDHLKEYRTAIISAAVTGKIDVREEAA